ncbi:hypothetical protein O181_020330 [Austropuccinia psidii MF-1]|uniref:Uncharacterized protein n=1 Tax=Austropuccinia psidii MF-1 TaxID=1389203 RepID=A0A9Q3CDJ4_9BASI|nr:hypothetical protein [Austropuccinia psidii MF-1]
MSSTAEFLLVGCVLEHHLPRYLQNNLGKLQGSLFCATFTRAALSGRQSQSKCLTSSLLLRKLPSSLGSLKLGLDITQSCALRVQPAFFNYSVSDHANLRILFWKLCSIRYLKLISVSR